MNDDEVMMMVELKRLLVPRPLDPDPGARYGMKFCGLLRMVLRRLDVTRVHAADAIMPVFEVVMELCVPDRDKPVEMIHVLFADEFMALLHHTDRGMTPEQSAIVQAIKVMWEHELDEGVIANGKHVWDPEPAHRGSQRP